MLRSLFLSRLVRQSLNCPDEPPKEVEDETDDRHRSDDPNEADHRPEPLVIREEMLLSHRLLLLTVAPGCPDGSPGDFTLELWQKEIRASSTWLGGTPRPPLPPTGSQEPAP